MSASACRTISHTRGLNQWRAWARSSSALYHRSRRRRWVSSWRRMKASSASSHSPRGSSSRGRRSPTARGESTAGHTARGAPRRTPMSALTLSYRARTSAGAGRLQRRILRAKPQLPRSRQASSAAAPVSHRAVSTASRGRSVVSSPAASGWNWAAGTSAAGSSGRTSSVSSSRGARDSPPSPTTMAVWGTWTTTGGSRAWTRSGSSSPQGRGASASTAARASHSQ